MVSERGETVERAVDRRVRDAVVVLEEQDPQVISDNLARSERAQGVDRMILSGLASRGDCLREWALRVLFPPVPAR